MRASQKYYYCIDNFTCKQKIKQNTKEIHNRFNFEKWGSNIYTIYSHKNFVHCVQSFYEP